MTRNSQSKSTPAWMQLDVIDLILLVVASAGVGLVYSWLLAGAPLFTRAIGVLAVIPLVVRRVFFPMPARGELRTGVLWSLASVIAGVSVCLGVVVFGFGAWSFFEYAKPEPDHSAEIAPALESYGPAALPAKKPGESDQEVLKRLQRGVEVGREKYRAQLLAASHDQWLSHRSRALRFSLIASGIGLAMISLGGLVDRLRCRKIA